MESNARIPKKGWQQAGVFAARMDSSPNGFPLQPYYKPNMLKKAKHFLYKKDRLRFPQTVSHYPTLFFPCKVDFDDFTSSFKFNRTSSLPCSKSNSFLSSGSVR